MSGSPAFVPARKPKGGFTLVELLVSMTVLVIIMGILMTMTQQTGQVWKSTTGKVEGFRNARVAFDAMTRAISQASLNTYYDYAVVSSGTLSFVGLGSGTVPTTYARNSDLQFVTGQGASLLTGLTKYTPVTHAIFFQSPLGNVSSTYSSASSATGLGSLNGVLNACGFYVAYGPDLNVPAYLGASYPTTRYRYRLMQFVQPSDSLALYGTLSTSNPTGTMTVISRTTNKGTPNWYLPFIQSDLGATAQTSNYVLAENIIALIVLPRLATKDETAADTAYGISTSLVPLGTGLAPKYIYDSSTVGLGGAYNATGTTSQPLLNSMNQLPPVVQVTMVAIDEASALRMGNTTTAPLTTLSTLFTDAKNYQPDMKILRDSLIASHINFHVFQTEVGIRGAKWTSN